jgi:hypothetical protein
MRIVLVALVFSALSVQAEVFTDDAGINWSYSIENPPFGDISATLTQVSNASGAVTVPSITGHPTYLTIRKIGDGINPVFGASPVTSIVIPPGVETIAQSAFQLCNATSVTIPNSVTSIHHAAFHRSGLTSVTIPGSVTNIATSAFSYCNNLIAVTISNGVANIGANAFEGCINLTSIAIPDSVTAINMHAFKGCSRLTTITLGSGLVNLDGNAFSDCPITRITFNGETTNLGAGVFNNYPSVLDITISQNSVNDLLRLGFSQQIAYATKAKYQGSLAAIDLANNEAFITAMANFLTALATNDGFLSAVANKIKQTQGTYGIATQSAVSNTITSLATKAELTASLAQSRADGINSVLSNPNLWTLYTTSQIQGMAIGDLVLTRTNGGQFVLNYDIEQSEDLANWTPYQGFALPLTNLPTNKAFVRIKAKQ